ncbi:MAG TPA: DUF983 domain-containing protein [Roseiarcus sp.]|nr:DUF983 domain-containing protein [Roseiarcus sp.]
MTDLPLTDLPLNIETIRPIGRSVRRGLHGCCPNCGKGQIFRAYLKVVDRCEACGEELYHHRADDAPAYVTLVIVCHFILAGVLASESVAPNSPFWVPALFWSALALASSMWILPHAKGALIAMQWANRMHGFGGHLD